MQTLAKRDAPSVPAPLPQQLHHSLGVYVARLDPPLSAGVAAYEIPQRDAPTGSDRLALTQRRDQIDVWLRPAGEGVAARFYAIFQASMGVKERTEQEALLHMRAWIADCATVPEFALDKACAALRQGVVGEGRWMPDAGPVLIEARKHVTAYAKERRNIEAVLNAKVITTKPDERRKAALVAAARSLVKTMPLEGARAEAERLGRKIEAETQKRLDEPGPGENQDQFRARMLREAAEVGRRPMPKMGDALRRSIGLPPAPEPDWRDDEHAA